MKSRHTRLFLLQCQAGTLLEVRSFLPGRQSHFCFSSRALNRADLQGMLHKSALVRHRRSFPPHFHSQRCVSNITGSVTEPRVQASDSAFPPHPYILYLSPFNLLWSWISSRPRQPLCTTPSKTWQHAAPRVKVLKDSAQCKGSIPEFTKQARQTATRFLIHAGPGTGGVATACHSRVSIHCCLAAKVLLLLEILETALLLTEK